MLPESGKNCASWLDSEHPLLYERTIETGYFRRVGRHFICRAMLVVQRIWSILAMATSHDGRQVQCESTSISRMQLQEISLVTSSFDDLSF